MLSSCSSIRLQYSSNVEAEGKSGRYIFEKSYDVSGGIPLWCGLSAIFFGGACWYYLAMPTELQLETLRQDAKDYLDEQLKGASYSTSRAKIRSTGWSESEEIARLQLAPVK